MIEQLTGTLLAVEERNVTLSVAGVGFKLSVPDTSSLITDTTTTLQTYMHWNQEKGPRLYGFSTQLDRTVFCLIIECPKIGPSIALSVLAQMTSGQFLEAITSQNDKALSAINGIGTKKAEQIITSLRHKVSKLINTGKLKSDEQQDFTHWQNVSEVLSSLNYSRQEINQAMSFLTDKYAGQNCPLDQLIRASLSYLSK